MRILLVNAVCGVTSTGRICTDLAKYLEENGHEVKIAYGRDDKGHIDACERFGVRIGTNLDVKIHGMRTRLLDQHGFGSCRATAQFLKWVDSYAPDIIHLHNLHGYYINIEFLFRYIKEKNIPVVWTLHDCWAMTGHCTYFSACGCEKWKTQCGKCPQKHEYPQSNALDASKRNYKRKKNAFRGVKNLCVTTPSAWLKSVVEQSFLQEYEVQVGQNGIDTAIFKPTESDLREQYGLVGQRIAIGVSNGWDSRKGLEYLKRMAGDLPQGWNVVAVGLSEEQMKELPDRMVGIRRTSSAQELAAWYTTADVFVNPTLEDNYPTTTLEAQACGTPSVVFASGGAPETLIPGNGYVIRRLNYDELLQKTILGADLKRGLVRAEIKDKRELGKEYEAIYKGLLERRGQTR